jgi:phosphatidylglycerophosphatase A
MKWEIILVLSAALAIFALRVLRWSPGPLFDRLGFDPVLWVAQGFGLGRIRYGPGTFGSLGGLLWFALLLKTGSLLLFTLGALAGIPFSVWVCDRGEKILRQKDPGSLVMDEIIAIPICFFFWAWVVTRNTGSLPQPGYFFGSSRWMLALCIFALFRLFDITKPWPVSKSQALPGGWGVTVDDVLAAGYVNLVCAVIYAVKSFS